jgi:4-amino-4-deoxy-L-arabinose transferase-like glycosyltransferase
LILVDAGLESETLFLVLELAACAAVVQQRRSTHPLRWAVAAGMLCGLAALTRTIGALLVVPLMLAHVGRRKRWRQGLWPVATLLLATVLVLAPWTARNALVMHSFVPISTEGGAALAGGYNSTVTRSRIVWASPWALPDFGDLCWRLHYRRLALRTRIAPGAAPRAWRTDLPEAALDRRLRSAAIDYIADHPIQSLEKVASNAATLFELRGPDRANFSAEEVNARWPRRLAAYGFLPVLVLAFVGALTAPARRASYWLWLVPTVFLSATAVDGYTRFRAPIDVFLIMLAALAIDALAERIRPTPDAQPSPDGRASNGATTVERP